MILPFWYIEGLLYTRIHAKRPVGRPRRRWEDAVDKDAREILKVRSWRMAADRGEWGRCV